jgi:nitrogenase-associated protein
MQKITFYVKPGENAEFIPEALVGQGYDIEIRDLSTETWTPALLRPYFSNKPVAEWFNPKAPQVLSGAIDPRSMHAQGALVAMTANPELIRTPLVKLAGRCGADLTEAEWPDFLAGKPQKPSDHGAIPSEFWTDHHD